MKVVLTILDGVGLKEDSYGNAFKEAKTPNFDYLWNKYPHCRLEASGEYVGIPKGQMGNSEVGHTNIGAGRIVYQSLVKINKSIEDNSFYTNEAFLKAINNCKENDSALHLLGLVSDGGIHSHINHLVELLELCKKESFNKVYIHALLDGRDTEPLVAPKFIEQLEKAIDRIGVGKIITIGGRYYAMNRDRNWDLTELAYNAIINGESEINVKTIEEAFQKEYVENNTDEFMRPTVLESVPVNDGDSMIMFNYRSDRMIQLLRSLKEPSFSEFKHRNIDLLLVTMTDYEKNDNYKNLFIAFPNEDLSNTLGEIISKKGLSQLRLSEFEKSGHITFYFNGCKDIIYPNEDRKIFERSNVFTYDEEPKMRSYDITQHLIDSLDKYDVIIVNYPNGDALGHTGIYSKVIEGIEELDKCIGKLFENIVRDDVVWIVTADHGNCENMLEPDGTPNKMHTTSQVPFIIVSDNYNLDSNYVGKLADIAPTILKIMDLEIPNEMNGNILIK